MFFSLCSLWGVPLVQSVDLDDSYSVHAPGVLIYLGNWIGDHVQYTYTFSGYYISPHAIYLSTWMSTLEHFYLDTILVTGDVYGLPGSVFVHS